MEPRTLRRAYAPAAILVVGAGAVAAALSLTWARDFVFAGLWWIVNLRAWQGVVESGLVRRSKARTLAWAVVKVPLLFGMGILYVTNVRDLHISAMLAGFHVIFLVLVVLILRTGSRPTPAAGEKQGE